MKWTPYEVNSSGNSIYLDYDNREYFSYNGYGHNHTLLPNTEGGCAIGIGNVDTQDADVTATWCIMPYNIYTEKKTDENTNGIPVITSIKRDASATMNIGSKNNKFNCLYVNAIHMGGHTYTSLNSGGGKIASYKATASQVNYNDDPKVETSVNTAGDTLTFKFSIPKGKDGTNGKDGKNGTRGPQGATGPRGPAGSVDYTSVTKIYHNSEKNRYAEVTSNGSARYFGPYEMEGLNLGNASYKWKNIYYTGALNGGSDEYIKDDIKSINTISSIDKFYIALKAGWEKLLDVLGLETKASLQKKALEKKLSDMEQKIADFEQSQHNYHDQSINIRDKLEDNQKVLQDGINELKTLLINKEIDDIRTTILEFSNTVMNDRDYNKEQYEHIIDLYDKYEKILEQNGMTNGRVTASMEFVLKNYQDLMDNGFKK